MSSYVITGVSRGLGWEFMNQVSNDPKNTVVGIVRNKPSTDEKVARELSNRSNITILQADLSSYEELKSAAEEVAAITGGGLDYLIANAAYITEFDAMDPVGVLGLKHREMAEEFQATMKINVLGNIYLFSLFMPLVLKGEGKKVLALTSGLGDIDWTNDYELEGGSIYAMSKAAMNMAVAKFHAQYKEEGVLFVSICPGFVDVGKVQKDPSPENAEKWNKTLAKFVRYAPDFKGPGKPSDAVKAVLSVLNNSSIEQGDGGHFLSHYKNKQWL